MTETSEEGDVLPPIKLGGGKTLSIQSDGAEITSYFCWCYKTERKVIMWNTIEQMSVDWHCFSRSITLKMQGAEVYTFKVSRSSSLLLAASSIQKMRDKTRSGRCSSVPDPKLNERLLRKDLGLHDKVGIMNVGLMVKKRTGCCQSTGFALPWHSLVTASLSQTWCGKEITVTTQVTSDEAYNKSLGEELSSPEDDVSEDTFDGVIEEAKNATLETLIEHMNVSWRGGQDYAEAAFDEVTYMMGAEDGEEFTHIHNKTDTMTMTLGETGIKMKTTSGGNCFREGKISRIYMPWSSVVSSSWSSPGCFGCCWAPLMTLMDLNGNNVKVKSISEKDYKFFVEKLGEKAPQEPGWGGKRPRLDLLQAQSNTDSTEPRGVLDVQPGGVHIHKRLGILGKETIFVPWSKVDSARVQAACIGGHSDLMTTSGQAIPVATSCSLVRRKGLWSICRQMHELKYGTQAPPEDNIYLFNESRTPITSVLINAARSFGCSTWVDGARQNGMRSEVNDYNVKLVLEKDYCTRFIREFDLVQIDTCRVTADNILVMKVRCSGGDLEIVMAPLDKGEDGDDIVRDILARRLQKLSRDSEGNTKAAASMSMAEVSEKFGKGQPLAAAVQNPLAGAPAACSSPPRPPQDTRSLTGEAVAQAPALKALVPDPRQSQSKAEVMTPMPSAPPLSTMQSVPPLSNSPSESILSPPKVPLALSPPKTVLVAPIQPEVPPALSPPKTVLLSPSPLGVPPAPVPPKVAGGPPKAALAGSLSEAIEARRAAAEAKRKSVADSAEQLLADARTDARLQGSRLHGNDSPDEAGRAQQLLADARTGARLKSSGANSPNNSLQNSETDKTQ